MNTIIFIGGIGFQEVLIIALVVLLFFGKYLMHLFTDTGELIDLSVRMLRQRSALVQGRLE